MSTLLDIGNEVSLFLNRDDVADYALNAALRAYRLITGRVPFDALKTMTGELPLPTSSTTYSLASLSPELAGIISVRVTANGRVRRLARKDPRLFDEYTALPGCPASYGYYGDSIEFDRKMQGTGTFRLRYWSRPVIADDIASTVLVTPPEWDELFFWLTLEKVYWQQGDPEKAMALSMPAALPRQMSPVKTRVFEYGIIPRLMNDLLMTIKERGATDESTGLRFVLGSITGA